MNYMANDEQRKELFKLLKIVLPVDHEEFMKKDREDEITNRLMGEEPKEQVSYSAYAEGPNGERMTKSKTETSIYYGVTKVYRRRGFHAILIPNNPGMYEWTKIDDAGEM